MQQERIIILGAGVMQRPAIKIAKELGFFTVVVDGSKTAPCIELADQFEQIDLKDKEKIETFARTLQKTDGLGGIMTAGTDFSASVAWVAEKLGLPGIPHEAAMNASDKGRMRACFKKAGLPSPEFVTIVKPDWRDDLFPSFPLVIKPVDNMGGRGCRRVDSAEEFEEAAADALRFSRTGRAIVEAFMDGPEFSVDAIVYHGEITICGLADRHIFFPPWFIEMGHTMPTIIPQEQQDALLETFCAGIRALGLAGEESVGAAKGDIKLTPSGPMIGEIAARLSGGYMSGWTYPYASGVEPTRAAILAAMGRKPEDGGHAFACLTPQKNWTSAERAFISIPGTVKALSGIAAARKVPHVNDLFLRISVGDKVDFPRNNVSKCGNIISAAPDRATAVDSAETAARAILIRLDPADDETWKFLDINHPSSPFASSAPLRLCVNLFPPSAFQLSPEIEKALAQLPDSEVPAPIGDTISLLPFPEFTASGLKDYMGRTVAESLQQVRALTGLALQEIDGKEVKTSDNGNNSCLLGRSFWTAFVRGGYQGAVYYIDRLGM